MAARTTKLTHLSPTGRSRMVDVSEKAPTRREAVAEGTIQIAPPAMEKVREGSIGKGNVVEVARLAGIMAAKKTSDLIPLCHPLALTQVEVGVTDMGCGFHIRARVRSTGPTGVEMEALTAVSVTALTVYDMLKAVDRGMVIGDIRLIRKTGGQSGAYVRKESQKKA